MSDVVWETPSPAGLTRRGGYNGVWRDRLEPLMDRPGEWARVYEAALNSRGTIMGHMKHRRYVYPEGRWEFTTRTNPDDPTRYYLYARYLGPDEEGGE